MKREIKSGDSGFIVDTKEQVVVISFSNGMVNLSLVKPRETYYYKNFFKRILGLKEKEIQFSVSVPVNNYRKNRSKNLNK